MTIPNTEHTSRPWRIHELTRDFRLEDVWAVPVAGGRDDFPRLVAQLTAADPSRGSSRVSRILWTARSTIGDLLSWDSPGAGLGSRVTALRERLPADLRSTPGPDFAALPFTSLYLLGDEFAAEIANHTVHGVMHLGWVADGKGAYRGQLAVLVKPNGWLGAGYLAAIKPFRHLIVYPRMMRDVARRWRDDAATPTASGASGNCHGCRYARTERRPCEPGAPDRPAPRGASAQQAFPGRLRRRVFRQHGPGPGPHG
jgi:hypothetical protein